VRRGGVSVVVAEARVAPDVDDQECADTGLSTDRTALLAHGGRLIRHGRNESTLLPLSSSSGAGPFRPAFFLNRPHPADESFSSPLDPLPAAQELGKGRARETAAAKSCEGPDKSGPLSHRQR
jgi:hypothetical protein